VPSDAKQDALRRCNAKTKRQRRIYAVGMDVVWTKEAIPLPAPADLRFEPLGIPLVPGEVPLIDRGQRERIANLHMKASNHRALAITTRGAWPVPDSNRSLATVSAYCSPDSAHRLSSLPLKLPALLQDNCYVSNRTDIEYSGQRWIKPWTKSRRLPR
jgi:hypothetical protein